MGRTQTLVGIVGALLLASASVAFAQAPAAKTPPAAAPAAPPKFVTPFKGQGVIEILAPQTSRQGNVVVTKIKIKNLTKGPLIGFIVDEYWYSAKGDQVSGSPSYRHPKPFMPNEVIEATLRSPYSGEMNRSLRQFKHLNGSVKATQVGKFKADS
jgi:hypothetical protein